MVLQFNKAYLLPLQTGGCREPQETHCGKINLGWEAQGETSTILECEHQGWD